MGRCPFDALVHLWALGAGDQISRMIVGALRDCGEIKGGSGDVKADVHLRRVLGRAVDGEEISAAKVIELTRQLNPTDPWRLDWPLWNIGKYYCRPTNPKCSECYLHPHCEYYRKSEFFRSIAVIGAKKAADLEKQVCATRSVRFFAHPRPQSVSSWRFRPVILEINSSRWYLRCAGLITITPFSPAASVTSSPSRSRAVSATLRGIRTARLLPHLTSCVLVVAFIRIYAEYTRLPVGLSSNAAPHRKRVAWRVRPTRIPGRCVRVGEWRRAGLQSGAQCRASVERRHKRCTPRQERDRSRSPRPAA